MFRLGILTGLSLRVQPYSPSILGVWWGGVHPCNSSLLGVWGVVGGVV